MCAQRIEDHFQYLIDLSLNGGPEPHGYEELSVWFNTTIHMKRKGKITKNQIRELWDLCGDAFSTKTLQGLVVRKPHGYAGDFETIDKIHTEWISSENYLRQWDLYFHSTAATKAVRNRKQIFYDTLNKLTESNCSSLKVLNVGSGPARDLQEYFYSSKPNNIFFDCVDIDSNAIAYAKELNKQHCQYITWHNRNIFRYDSSEKYDLIWSAGLFDYLNEKQFIFLLKHIYGMMNHDGRIIIGNFSTVNPTQADMEFGEWFLEHRTKEQLKQLARAANIPDKSISVSSEPLGVNLFLNIKKHS